MVKVQLMLRYDISAAGEVNVTEKMTTDKEAQVADLFRFGHAVCRCLLLSPKAGVLW